MAKFSSADKIKVGVIGYGGSFNMGKAHLEEMQQAGMTPVAVCEIDEARRKAAGDDFPGIQLYDSVATMLKKSDVNLVVLITPHNTHAKLALQCLKAGRHVVCEKPLAITTAECDAMIREAKKRKLVLSTYHNRHWDGWILDAVRLINEEKVIGDVYRVDARMGQWGQPRDWWRSSKSVSGGILYDWGVHLLEYGLQILRSDIVEVSGFHKTGFWASQTKWKADTNEDEGHLSVRFRNGAWMTLTITQLDSNPKEGFIEFTGTHGSYIIRNSGREVITHNGKDTVVRRAAHSKDERWRFYQNIADHLTKGEKLIITPEWSRRPIHILDLGCKSAKLGKALKAKYK